LSLLSSVFDKQATTTILYPKDVVGRVDTLVQQKAQRETTYYANIYKHFKLEFRQKIESVVERIIPV